MITVGCKSDRGRRRETNEDAFAVVLESHVYIVADGVGGNNAGEIASSTAVRTVLDQLGENPLPGDADELTLRRYFDRCLELANEKVKAIGEARPETRGLATTMVICYVKDNKAYYVNVGDSRGYLYRDGKLDLITEDHSYVNTLIKMGVLSRDEAKNHKRGNVITRAIGAEDTISGDFFSVELKDGDVVLLCTDGLHGFVSSGEMELLLKNESDMQALAGRLIDAANAHGGRDNVTVVCLRYSDSRRED